MLLFIRKKLFSENLLPIFWVQFIILGFFLIRLTKTWNRTSSYRDGFSATWPSCCGFSSSIFIHLSIHTFPAGSLGRMSTNHELIAWSRVKKRVMYFILIERVNGVTFIPEKPLVNNHTKPSVKVKTIDQTLNYLSLDSASIGWSILLIIVWLL